MFGWGQGGYASFSVGGGQGTHEGHPYGGGRLPAPREPLPPWSPSHAVGASSTLRAFKGEGEKRTEGDPMR